MSGHGRGDAPGAAGRLSTQPLPTVTAGGMMALPVEEHDRASLAQQRKVTIPLLKTLWSGKTRL